jgi:ABC-type transport system involved in multi-copper enzyme maturation permease subunit
MSGIFRKFSVSLAIGEVTFREIVRDKVLYNMLLVGLLLLGMTSVATRLTYVRPERIAIDFGLSAIQIAMAMVATFVGAAMVGKEFERRTIYVALSRPISRLQFIAGKFLGLSAVLLVNWVLLVAMLLAILSMIREGFVANVSSALIWGLVLIYFQSCMLAAVAVLFSTFSTTSLAAAFTIGIYLVGSNISQMKLVAAKIDEPLAKAILNGFAAFLPNLEHFSLGFKVTYGLPVTSSYIVFGVVYALVVCSVCMMLSGYFVRSKDS